MENVSVKNVETNSSIDPVDYEHFIHENMDIIKGDSQSHLLLFPEGDVSVSSVQRKFRTIQYPVPGQAK